MNRRQLLAAFIAGLAAGPGLAHARNTRRGRTSRAKDTSGGVSVSADTAAKIARAATGGRVLSVKLTGSGSPWYRVKVLTDGGRVRTVGVDARSGAVRN